MTGTRSDYVRTDELDEALVPLDTLADLFGVTERTLRRWLDADRIERRPYNGGKAVRWGDIPKPDTNATRWVRR